MDDLSRMILLELSDNKYSEKAYITTIIIDFINDFKTIYINAARRFGVRVKDDSDLTVIRCLTFFRKLGGNNKKRIHYSKGFQAPKDKRRVINHIIKIISEGKSIAPYLSNQSILIDSEPDLMFSDWGILHLHLGTFKDKANKHFVERTSELLFLKIEENDAYIIGVYKHEDQIWAKKEIVQKVYDNWPHLFYELNDISLTDEVNDDERKLMRKQHMNVLTSLLDNKIDKSVTVVSSSNFGMVSSGDSIEAVRVFDYMYNTLKELEKEVIKSTNGKYKIFKHVMHINHQNTIKLSLINNGRFWYVMDLHNHFLFFRFTF